VLGTCEWAGYWWLPADQTNRLRGTLGVVGGGASLDVVGDFGHEDLTRSETGVALSIGPADRECILGLTADGERITFVDCSTRQWSSHSSGVAKTAYRP